MLDQFRSVSFDDGENFYQATQIRRINRRGRWSMVWRVDKQAGQSWISVTNVRFKTLDAVRNFLTRLTKKKIAQHGLT